MLSSVAITLVTLFGVSVIAIAVLRHRNGACTDFLDFALSYMPLLTSALLSTTVMGRSSMETWSAVSVLLTLASIIWFALVPLSEFTGIRYERDSKGQRTGR